MKRNSLIIKTLINIVLFSVSLLLILWIFQIVFLNFFYEKYTIKKMDEIKTNILNSEYENLNYQLETIAYQNNVCIELYADNLLINFNTKIKGCQLGRNNRQIEVFEQAMMQNSDVNRLELVDPNYKTKSLLYGINYKNNFIFIYTTLEDIDTTTVVLKSQLIYITLAVMVLSVLIAYFISKRITSPIVKMTESAKKLGTGNYNIKFAKSGIIEIDELADSLNYATEELGKTIELRRDLMANVSHDLKTPLTMIKAYSEMIRDYTYKDKIKRNANLDVIVKETDRLNILVNDILDLSKLEANKDNLNIEEFDLVKEIKEILKRYDYLIKDGYKIKYQGLKTILVKADKNKINQVVYNLINNAINYTGNDKVVTISLTKESEKILVEVIDTGKGIKKEEIKYIWDKYYKSNKNHQRSKIGTGIGLSIVKEILTYHNFEYGVKSIIGKGTTFYFYVDL